MDGHLPMARRRCKAWGPAAQPPPKKDRGHGGGFAPKSDKQYKK